MLIEAISDTSWLLSSLNWIAPLFVTVLFGVLNLCTAISNLKIAKQQTKLQNNSFCYQLFDRRMKIYTSIKEVLALVIQNAAVPVELLNRYLQESRETAMLFGPEVVQKVDDIYKVLVKYHTVSTMLSHNLKTQNCTPNHEELCNQDAALLQKIIDENTELIHTFEGYISFKDYRIESKRR